MRTIMAILIAAMAAGFAAELHAQALWRTAAPRKSWYAAKEPERRIWKLHDHVKIKINHSASGKLDDRFESRKEFETEFTISDFIRFGKGGRLTPSTLEDLNLAVESEMRSRDEGRRRRTSAFSDVVTATVTQVMPDYDPVKNVGKLMIRAIKEVQIGNETERVEMTGIVDVKHVDTEDSIDLSEVAEPKVRFYGNGDVSDSASMGWLARIASWAWPF